MKHTDATARQFVKETLDPDSAKFDIDAIAEELRNTHGTWDFSEIEGDAYWAVVAKHDREAADAPAPRTAQGS